MTITAKFSSVCPSCGQTISAGDQVEWMRGTQATHAGCKRVIRAVERFKRQSTGRSHRYGSSYTRFASGAEVFTNRRGRCEDAPCCGCCS